MKISRLTLILSLALASGVTQAADLSVVDEKAFIREGNAALAQKDYMTAFLRFSALAERGLPAAQFNLGAFYLNGQGIEKDEKVAYEWFAKASAQGHARSTQILEKAAAQGNTFAANELNQLHEREQAKVQADAKAKADAEAKAKAEAEAKAAAEAQAQEAAKYTEDPSLFKDPTLASRGKTVYGASADVFSHRAWKPLSYSVAGTVSSATDSGDYLQSGMSAWMGFDDLSLLASFRHGGGRIETTTTQGSVSDSFQASTIEVDGRWIMRKFSTDHVMPYVLAGYAQQSLEGTADELQFKDNYTQTDRILLAGGGAIFLLNEEAGIRVETKWGMDNQKRSGTSLNGTYSATSTSGYTELSATFFYDLVLGWNAQFTASYDKYYGGYTTPSSASFFAKFGYSYK